MYEALTVEQIKTNILNRLTTNLQTREGSYTNDVISAAAAEIAACYHSMDALVPSFYLDETSGAYIDRQAAVVASPGRRGARPPASFGSQAATGPRPPPGRPFTRRRGWPLPWRRP